MRRPPLFAAALALVASLAAAQEPKARITGPKEAELGDLVILDATQSTGNAYLWRLINSDKTYLPVDNNLRVVFSSGTPGPYIFALIAAGTNANKGPACDIATHTLTVKGKPAPTPTPEPEPDPTPPADLAALRAAIPTWITAAGLTQASRKDQARKIAQAFQTEAPKARQHQTLATLTEATSAAYRDALGLNATVEWRPVLLDLETWLTKHPPADPAACSAAWLAAADGFLDFAKSDK